MTANGRTQQAGFGPPKARNRATETSIRRLADEDVKRGNLHPEQHQVGMRRLRPERVSRPEHAGRWLEPVSNGGPRWMAAIGAQAPVTESGLQALSELHWLGARGRWWCWRNEVEGTHQDVGERDPGGLGGGR